MDSRQNILSKVKEKVRLIDSGAKVILFGSRARGDYRNNSDWDFLILTRYTVTKDIRDMISDVLFEVELETNTVLTAIVQNIYSWEDYSETPIYKNIYSEGVEL